MGLDRVGLSEKEACEPRLERVKDLTMLLPWEEHCREREQPMQRPWGRSVLHMEGLAKRPAWPG